MKKTFRTILAGALALLTVSCYDDSALRTDIADLKERVTELENKLNSEVSTLNTTIGALQTEIASLKTADANFMTELGQITAQLDAIDGKIDGKVSASESAVLTKIEDLKKDYAALEKVSAETIAKLTAVGVTKVEKNAAGNAVITFVDGNTVEVPAKPSTGIVTIVDGKWAVVGADGKTTVLDAQLHPDTKIEFQVDPKTGELKYSLGGQFVSTGAYVAGETFSVVTNVVEGDGIVTITIGGVEYDLPLVSTNTFEIVSGKVFFQSYQTKSIPVMMDGVVSSMVANKPAGWNVALVNDGLKVTAPGASEDDWGDWIMDNPEDEASGIIEIWVVTRDGKTFVGKLSVTLASQANYATINVKEDSVRIDVGESFIQGDFYYGACKLDEYDPESLFAKISGIVDYDNMPEGVNRFFDLTYGDEPWVKTTLPALLGADIELGNTYVVWGICMEMGFDMETYRRVLVTTSNDFITSYVTPMEVECSAQASWNNAELKVAVKGAKSFYGAIMLGEQFESMWPYLTPEWLAGNGGLLKGLQALTNNAICEYETEYEGKASVFGYSADIIDYAEPLYSGSEYKVLILPIDPLKSASDYQLSDVVIKDFATTDLGYNGKATVTFGTPDINFVGFKVDINNNGGDLVLYKMFTEDEYNSVLASAEEGEGILEYMMDNYASVYKFNESSSNCNFDGLKSGALHKVVAVAIDSEGKCSEAAVLDVTTTPVPYDNDNSISVTVASAVVDASDATKVHVTYNVTGASHIVTYSGTSGAQCTSSANVSASWTQKVYAQPGNYQVKKYPVENGTVTITYIRYSSSNKYVHYCATNYDESGVLAEMTVPVPFDLSAML